MKYANKTFLFLSPIINDYGDDLCNFLRSIHGKSYAIYDYDLYSYPDCYGRNIFIRCDVLDFAKVNEGNAVRYKTNIDICLLTTKNSPLLIRIPIKEKYYHAYDSFLKGKYSQMYDKKQIKDLFNHNDKKQEYIQNLKTYSVLDFLNRTDKGFGYYKDEILSLFDIEVKKKEMSKDSEYLTSPRLEEETFNCKSSKFIEESDIKDWLK